MTNFKDFREDEVRFFINIRSTYDQWLQAAKIIAPGSLQWKGPDDRKSLYRIVNAHGGPSLGPRSEETERLYEEYRVNKKIEADRWDLLLELSRQYSAFRLPKIMQSAGPILRELDLSGYLGAVQVVGTNAMYAYQIEAQVHLVEAVTATEDFDLSWTTKDIETRDGVRDPDTLFQVLKRVDSTFTINTERTFQAINAKGDEVELLIAPSLIGTIPQKEKFRSIPFEEQEWLLLGDPVDQIVFDSKNKPVRIVAPDPRYFALQKLWLADKPQRNPLKKPKDRTQGNLVLNMVHYKMPHYPLNDRFEQSLPEPLKPYFEQWKQTLAVPSKHKM